MSRFPLLSRAPITVDVNGARLTLPWRSAREWTEALGEHATGALLRLVEDPEDTLLKLAEGTVRLKAVDDALHQALAELTGRPWYEAHKLLATGAEDPSVLGELTLSGVDPDRVSVGQWCAAVYRVLTRHADKDGRSRIDFELAVPPPGEEQSWDDGSDFNMAELAAFVQAQGG